MRNEFLSQALSLQGFYVIGMKSANAGKKRAYGYRNKEYFTLKIYQKVGLI